MKNFKLLKLNRNYVYFENIAISLLNLNDKVTDNSLIHNTLL